LRAFVARIRVLGFAFTSFASLFRKIKHFTAKMQLVQDLIPPPIIYIFTRVSIYYIYVHVYIHNNDDCSYNFKSSLVPLVEGLCSSDSCSRFCIHIVCFAFSEDKTVYRKNAISPRSSRLPSYTFIHVYPYTNTYMPRFNHLDSSGPPGVSSWPLGSHPSTPCAVCVCLCVYTLIH